MAGGMVGGKDVKRPTLQNDLAHSESVTGECLSEC